MQSLRSVGMGEVRLLSKRSRDIDRFLQAVLVTGWKKTLVLRALHFVLKNTTLRLKVEIINIRNL